MYPDSYPLYANPAFINNTSQLCVLSFDFYVLCFDLRVLNLDFYVLCSDFPILTSVVRVSLSNIIVFTVCLVHYVVLCSYI